MANTEAFATVAKVDALKAIVPNASTIKAALYSTTATTNASNTVYTATGEVTGTGYTAGGETVTHATAAQSTGTTAFWTPSAPVVFTAVSIGPLDCVMFYDETRSNATISTHTFGNQTVTAGTLTLVMPTNDATTGLVRIA